MENLPIVNDVNLSIKINLTSQIKQSLLNQQAHNQENLVTNCMYDRKPCRFL